MRIVVLGGYGEIGAIVTYDLVKTCKKAEIIVAGRNTKKAERYAQSFKQRNVKGVGVDIKSKKDLVALLRGSAIVVNCTQYAYNLEVMNAALEAGCHYLDLGGLFHMTKKQLKLDAQFKKKKLIAILGCGSTPGITNVLAAYGARFFDVIKEIHISFAGYDFGKHRHHFVLPYSIFTLEDEISKEPAILHNGKIIFVRPLSGKEVLAFPKPIGDINGYYTLHSELATFPASFKKKGLEECTFRVTFSDDFIHDIKLIIESGFLSKKPITIGNQKVIPADVAVKELNRLIPSKKDQINDIEYVRVEIKGKIKGKKQTMILDCLTKSDASIPAGSVDTGIPPSIISQMILAKKIKKYGVLPPEQSVDPETFFAELKKRKIKINTEIRTEKQA